jgi:sigma-B regulation protein RsbU (phosphoserine phosphatase)
MGGNLVPFTAYNPAVARIRDWMNLGRSTLDSLKARDLADMYTHEWPETRDLLIAEHRAAIDNEPRRIKRVVRRSSAIVYGLAKRLAPHRRMLFVLAVACFTMGTCGVLQPKTTHVSHLGEMIGAFGVITLLLAFELIDKIKYRDELELARELQKSLVPANPPHTREYDIAAFNLVANTVGGDIYDFVPLPDGRLAVLFGDASGHGMAAGLVMAVAHASFHTQLEIDPSPACIFATLNRMLCRTGGSRSFFAGAYVMLEQDGHFTAMLAGHPPILKVDAAGKVIDHIGKGAYPLGVKASLRYEEQRGYLGPAERLVLHSDGLTEARSPSGQDFGDEIVEAIIGWAPTEPAATTVDNLAGEWRRFVGQRPAEDDVSIAVIRRIAHEQAVS